MSKFHLRLRELRSSRKLSQQKLSEQLGISKSSINMYERGEREPGIDLLEAIADFFNVDLDYLTGMSESPRKSLQKEKSGDDDLKFALFNGSDGITDEMFEEVKAFAAFVKQREQQKGKDKK
ncbi:MAG: helix-turn-helix transcriptional regulator [Bacteroides sp.]|nr:helix-turn-helix transcriptional regulator [Eubacterium sp.]MCM1419378.1 helix-turn-helix transcriptional regulator [Roseburia sp.]MCM1463200.1 helix-turn-helix transcriptional regulator [Bacteroides sp.]